MSVFLFRVKNTAFERTQAKDGQAFVLHVKPDPLLDSCGAGDIAIVCTEVNKSAPACFALSACKKDTPLRFRAKIVKYDSSRKDAHLLKLSNDLEQYKNLNNTNTKVYAENGTDEVPAAVLSSASCEGMEVTVEKPEYSFQAVTDRCNLLLDGELVIESDTEDTQAYRKIEDEQYVSAIQSLISQKAESDPSSSSTPSSPSQQDHDTSITPQNTPTPPQTPTTTTSSSSSIPPPLPPSSQSKPKPAAKTAKPPRANGHASSSSGEKRESEESDYRENKKARVTPSSSPSLALSDISPVDLLKHVTSVAAMLKELDSEHSERLNRLEDEVKSLKARLTNSSLPPSPIITKDPAPVGPGRPKKKITADESIIQSSSASPSSSAGTPKVPKPTDPLHFSPGEFIAVRVDPSSSTDGYWMARVTPGTPKQGLVRVKWFEKYAPLPGWYFMDTKEDLVDPLSIFHRNFELIVKPWKNRAGHFIDIYKPVLDLASFDSER